MNEINKLLDEIVELLKDYSGTGMIGYDQPAQCFIENKYRSIYLDKEEVTKSSAGILTFVSSSPNTSEEYWIKLLKEKKKAVQKFAKNDPLNPKKEQKKKDLAEFKRLREKLNQ